MKRRGNPTQTKHIIHERFLHTRCVGAMYKVSNYKIHLVRFQLEIVLCFILLCMCISLSQEGRVEASLDLEP